MYQSCASILSNLGSLSLFMYDKSLLNLSIHAHRERKYALQGHCMQKFIGHGLNIS
jgi:hypothetical protein